MKEIFERVSIRKYTDQTVEPEKVEKILRAACAAPSAGNQQPWEFFVIRDKAVIEELSHAHKYSDFVAGAGLVIVPCYRTEGLMFPEYDTIDTSLAVENMLLEIQHLGLGTCFIGIAPEKIRIGRVAKAINCPENLIPYTILPIGYPAESRAQQDRYDESRIHYIG